MNKDLHQTIDRYRNILGLKNAAPSSQAIDNLKFDLRKYRHQGWILAAEQSLLGQTPLEVCKLWSLHSEKVLNKAFEFCFNPEKFILLAFGKLGSYELNVSSDVDILVISVENSEDDWRPALRQFQNLLSENNSAGFCYRIDFDLRPGGRHGPLIPSLDQFEDYYGNYGETWERLALLRARAINGPSSAIERLNSFMEKFIWRKHLDFSLMDDLKKLRSKIQGSWSLKNNSGFNLKMNPGGIRDIELFCHALQVIHGGRAKEIRTRQIPNSYRALADNKLIPQSDADFLIQLYTDLRALENYTQSINDEQTHIFQIDDFTPAWASGLFTTIPSRCQRCAEVVADILGDFGEHSSLKVQEIAEELSVSQDESMQADWNEILETPVFSRNRTRDEILKNEFLQRFMENLTSNRGDKKRAVSLLKDFIKKTKAKTSFFELLLRNETLHNEISWLFGHSPYLAGILVRRPELLDSFIYRKQEINKSDWSELLSGLLEKKLLHELLSGSDYLRTKDLPKLQKRCTDIADEITSLLDEKLKIDFPNTLQIERLGKWGGRELGLRSDLDFIFITEDEPTDLDLKAARRFINRLTEAQSGGSLYATDMRLRPNGKGGPLISTVKDITDWLLNDAALWERQAWLKSKNFQKLCLNRKISKSNWKQHLDELWKIQNGLYENVVATGANNWDLKYSPGGFIDIELALQTKILMEEPVLSGTSTMDFFSSLGLQKSILAMNYSRMRQFEQMLQLTSAHSITNIGENHECLPQVAEALHLTPNQLVQELTQIFNRNLQELNKLDPRRTSQ